MTGATGTVGSEVVKQFISRESLEYSNHHIRAAVHSRNKSGNIEFRNGMVEITNMDYTKKETISNALDKVDKLFLQTLLIPNMTDLTSDLIKEAKRNDIKHIVKLSTMGAESDPESTILRLHKEEEKIIEESGIPYTFLRPNAFMQNFITQFGHTIRTQGSFYAPAADSKLGFVDARDVATIAVKTLMSYSGTIGSQHVNKAYEITGGDMLSYSQAAEILSMEAGKRISYKNVSEEDARKGMRLMKIDDWFVNIVLELFRKIRGGYGSQITATVEQIIGRKPISFGQFAKYYSKFFS
ncbi:SDR family oxidoreductase [Candidatus Nitrosocosmicus sp. SS]|uniref:SDR family oxidoreductase n=1 Tax=Candidatus Nitrosocosmicus agrestis TaxID=2563600 RepID=UPI001331269B|nr:SDR family oxidoreductase [Candidatus Nitrosocosmicus sp. SS]MDR4490268.1 SDR family oxidoreductase [Candidatus Nitrosocosmicus sp.]